MKNKNKITIVRARDNNLNNITLSIPRNKLITITGLSGSGKSTLAFDTIYSEGQRRYVESLSTYARQFLGGMKKPKVDQIFGLSPAISIQQKSVSKNPRSTVGTITEIFDYLRLLYARVGEQHCYKCKGMIKSQTVQQIVDKIKKLDTNTKCLILAPVIKNKKGQLKDVIQDIAQQGFTRIKVDNEILSLHDTINLEKNKKHRIDIIVDRISINKTISQRLTESVELALKVGGGILIVETPKESPLLFSEKKYCPKCDISFDDIEPHNFSFNSPLGACSKCNGLGTIVSIDPSKIIPDINKSLIDGCIEPLGPQPSGVFLSKTLKILSHEFHFSFSSPWKNLPKEIRSFLLHGSNSSNLDTTLGFEGIIDHLKRRYRQTKSNYVRDWIEKYMSKHHCTTCKGDRLNKVSLSVLINDTNIIDVTKMTIHDINLFLSTIKLSKQEKEISNPIIKEVNSRINFLLDVGLDYLTLHRSANTLSGGESQRIRLATQIGTQLMGVIYILDEPSIGLHQRDNRRLINTLLKLRDLGNTVIVVEHDSEIMKSSDWIIDLGPKAGIHGGDIVFEGEMKDLPAAKNSLTADYLLGKKNIPINNVIREGNGRSITIEGASGNNLKTISCTFPLGKFICVTGVSGSGKSTLINQTLYPILMQELYSSRLTALEYNSIHGVDDINKVIGIDQSPIGKTPRSNPATYTGVFTHIRNLFSTLPESKARGYLPGRFSFNVKGGRCEHCQGVGVIKVEMHFLPDTYISCELCKGKRFNRETLEIRYKGKNIYDILNLSIEAAADFFKNHNTIQRHLQMLIKVGLGYIKLGQRATTLSGGESQRVKLSTELSKIGTGQTLYILDEPTTGLHFHDINVLLLVLNELVAKGNTVIVIEHNLDVVKCADWIIDLGLEGGDKGGEIIFSGTPSGIIKNKKSYTGKYLAEMFEN